MVESKGYDEIFVVAVVVVVIIAVDIKMKITTTTTTRTMMSINEDDKTLRINWFLFIFNFFFSLVHHSSIRFFLDLIVVVFSRRWDEPCKVCVCVCVHEKRILTFSDGMTTSYKTEKNSATFSYKIHHRMSLNN